MNNIWVGLGLVLITTIGAIFRFIVAPELKQNKVWFWVQKAVLAIEQIIKEEGQGEIKKEFVIDFIKNKMKLDIDDEDLVILIEAVVYEMNKAKNIEE